MLFLKNSKNISFFSIILFLFICSTFSTICNSTVTINGRTNTNIYLINMFVLRGELTPYKLPQNQKSHFRQNIIKIKKKLLLFI